MAEWPWESLSEVTVPAFPPPSLRTRFGESPRSHDTKKTDSERQSPSLSHIAAGPRVRAAAFTSRISDARRLQRVGERGVGVHRGLSV